ncbi:PAS domain S-box protein [Vineibacter terrae]|uniref:PAS domain-containing sensor histidine kinase n=1 Tax=Vineibacter terrae TaxID=2586908 RepID=UPI002E33D119|nr:PAS domain S-box protein [Vineibacter terrae]HEX2885409.1 PAS domain S-box protein [Vineibacter terrae]
MGSLAGFGVLATIAFAAAGGSRSGGFQSWMLVVALAICSAGLFGATILLWRAERAAAMARQAAESASTAEARAMRDVGKLEEALNVIPVGFALYDRHERLVAFNEPYNRMIRHIGGIDRTMVGLTYEQVLTHYEGQMKAAFPDRDLSAWKAEYLKRFHERTSIDLQWENGRVVRLAQIQIPSGGVVLMRMDVSDLKQREQEALAAQKRFDVLVNSLSDAVFSTDREGRFSYVSGAMFSLLGYRPDELLGRRPHDITHPDDHAGLEACIERLRQNRGVSIAFAHRGLCKDGTIRQVDVRMMATGRADNLGGEFAVTGVVRDVQRQHELAERLRYELQRLDSVVQSSGAAIVLVDRDMRIIMANNGFINARPGRSAQDVIGQPLRALVENVHDQGVFDAWFAAGPSDPVEGLEYESSRTDHQGRRRNYHITANPVRDTAGLVQHIVFLAVDETERREAELQLFDSSRLATVGEMASGVAHEINQPLTIIRFAAESLLEQLQDASPDVSLASVSGLIDAKLSRIVSQTERAALIIQELKGFARQPDAAPRPFDVPATLSAAAQLLREQLRLSGIEQELDLAPGCPPVRGHDSRLQQVIINLILNARDAILERGAPGGETPRGGMIRIGARHLASTGKVVITVEDDGPGIPEAVLPRLFEPFFTTKPTGKGTGLGLSVGYQIVRQMGGTITAENRAEGGARFIMTLDAAPTDTGLPATDAA